MFQSKKDLLTEIENTLDQLIQNAKILKACDRVLCQAEALLLQKTQESLIAKFMHTQEYAEGIEPTEELLEKIRNLHSLSPCLMQSFSKELTKNPSLGSRPRIGRNRKKLKVREFAYRSF